jgi:hypothetical protein
MVMANNGVRLGEGVVIAGNTASRPTGGGGVMFYVDTEAREILVWAPWHGWKVIYSFSEKEDGNVASA